MVHEGTRYNIEILGSLGVRYDRDGCSHSRQNVVITDTKTGKRYQYVGVGQDMGNFHPIWIRAGKRHLQLTEVERATEDLFPARGHRLYFVRSDFPAALKA